MNPGVGNAVNLSEYDAPAEIDRIPANAVQAHHRYGVTGRSLALNRPDAHIAALTTADDLPTIRRYLDRWFRRPTDRSRSEFPGST